jgi:hypothetical protein
MGMQKIVTNISRYSNVFNPQAMQNRVTRTDINLVLSQSHERFLAVADYVTLSEWARSKCWSFRRDRKLRSRIDSTEEFLGFPAGIDSCCIELFDIMTFNAIKEFLHLRWGCERARPTPDGGAHHSDNDFDHLAGLGGLNERRDSSWDSWTLNGVLRIWIGNNKESLLIQDLTYIR